MAKITQKIKEKIRGTKHKVLGAADKTTNKAKEGVSSTTSKAKTNQQDSRFEKVRPGKEIGRREDPLTEDREKEPMTPAKIKQHEPTAVKREISEKTSGPRQTGTSSSEAAEKARRSGMTKGTADAAETASEYEEGADGASK
jgi:hypothetical protein